MTFQILISTLNGNFLKKTNPIVFDYILINQYDDKKLEVDNNNIYNFRERGLSKSRNHAIDLADADICLISDDDLEYIDDIESVITNAFLENKNADIITFQVQTPDGNMYKKYKPKSYWHTRKTIMSVSSVEIAFRLDSIKNVGLRFDERFGLGSSFPTGEEIVFLTEALKEKLNILYIPLPIVVHPAESSGKNYDSIALIEAKGAMFIKIFNSLGYFVSILFAYKKYRFSPFSFRKFIFIMFAGIRKYKRSVR